MDLQVFMDRNVLAERFRKVSQLTGAGAAVIAVRVGDTECTVSTPAARDAGTLSPDTPIHIGCIMKSMTASLVARAVEQGHIRFSDDVGRALHIEELEGIEIRQLLNHTHGLDGSLVKKVSLDDEGNVDLPLLRELLVKPARLAAPGQLYSYDNAGSCLAAALLERIYGKPFRALLAEELAGIVDGICANMCPATGAGMALSTKELLAWVSRHALPCGDPENDWAAYSALRSEAFKLPGWHPRIESVCMGWHVLGDGWFGYKGRMNDDSATVHFHPEQRVVMVVAGRGENTAAAVLAAIFPELAAENRSNGRVRFIPQTEWGRVDPARYTGTYENASRLYDVDVAANRSLRVRSYSRDAQLRMDERPEPRAVSYLKAAENALFLSFPPDASVPFVQFLRPNEKGFYGYIQIGQQVYARAASPR
jgi:hypothetical protein